MGMIQCHGHFVALTDATYSDDVNSLALCLNVSNPEMHQVYGLMAAKHIYQSTSVNISVVR